MYSRRQRPRLSVIIFLGIIIGVVFLVIDTSRQSTTLIPTQTTTSNTDGSYILPTIDPNARVTPQYLTAGQLNASPTPISVANLAPDIQYASITIPSAGIFAPIVRVYLDGTSWNVSNLGNNVGHLEGTTWLPNTGNVVLSGHVELADGRAGILANLSQVEIGDRIIILQDGIQYQYDIVELRQTTPDDLTPLYPSTDNRLTLITCGNYDFFADSYLERTIVTAIQVT